MEDLKNKFDSIIFDLDGTLWDSTANVAEAWQTAKKKVDYIKGDITTAHVESIVGLAYDAIFEKLFPYITEEQRSEFKKLAAKHELETLHEKGGHFYPELISTLRELGTRYKLYIVSNCQSGYIETFLKMDGVDGIFAGHQCYGTKGQPKWQNIVDVVNDYHLKAPVYVGDTAGDYEAAKKAGVPFIFAAYGFGKVNEDQVATIENFADLKNIL
ncbi:HAD family hydrolase [Mucilaginibacter sp. KACC 22063]|uniref:HAD family hydrolase n=1 Tax=Mucilaginibacter sp. KACC 22063 TaxID=3025666 RepID=UPI0023654D31|nr:HAD family hydrolase [Mucilaginibacter sp. KACC 22063]WDF54641.1 HAD family hydrolase [Mucilaginibacter sp. KACC 22063]